MEALQQRRPRVGVEQWENPRNGLVVCRLHYTADPAKRTPEWKTAAARNQHPRAWRREYEIDWTSPEGDPVIPEYQDEKHTRDFLWDRSLRLLRFWDFGFVSPVALFAQLTLFGQLRVRRELCPFNTPLNQLWAMVQAVTLELAGEESQLDGSSPYDVAGAALEEIEQVVPKGPMDAGDPAGTNQTDLGSSAEWLAGRGVQLHTQRPGTEVSYSNLRARFLRDVMEPGVGPVPALLLHPECKNLRAACAGAFHLSPHPPYKPVKTHPEKDVVDALRYGEDNLIGLGRDYQQALHRMAMADQREMRSIEERRVGPSQSILLGGI